MSVFKPVSPQVSFPEVESEVLAFWKEHRIFEKSLELTRDKPAYSFYDGPPFATGLPHYGHLVGGTLKDIVPRYWTMRGRHVERRFGWDCHGLPIESLVQKELGLASVKDIRDFGVGKFNETCRANVLKYVAEWRKTVQRMGRWVDFDNDYKTMDRDFMESVFWVFRQCYDKGLIYQDYRVQPYSPALATPLSNFEVNQGYQDRQDPAITVTFPVADDDAAFLVWTTTPWTLPGNLAIAVHPEMEYVKVEYEAKRYWIGAARASVFFKDVEPITTCKGSEFVGKRYEPLFTYAPQQSPKQYTFIAGDFVTGEDGTCAVHIAPSFGEEDFVVGRQNGLGLFDSLDAEGKFTATVPQWAGVDAKEADKHIIRALKERGRVFKHETIVHSYPHCWRTGVPLLYRALKTWFLSVEKEVEGPGGVRKPLKQWMVESNQQVRWVPDHLRDGRFGKWLEGARDWNLGRNRFWGTPIPVWIAEDGDKLCVGSVAELEALCGKKVPDLHLHVISELDVRTTDKKTYDPKGKHFRLTGEVLDCWFESGSMPYAQNHVPFENKAKFDASFPADFIAEGIDQTRGWFYTLTVLSSALFTKPAFKNVIVNGIILAENGQKMSKSLRNYTPPDDMMDRLGADSMRLFLINSPAVRAEDLRFSDAGVLEMARAVLLPFWNAYSFFVTYATVDAYKPSGDTRPHSDHELDRWIVSLLNHAIASINAEMENYCLYKVVPILVDFIDNLTNWYVRRSRRRFWKSENDSDKMQAYATLYYVLVQFAKTLAPFLPFVSESVYRNLAKAAGADDAVSVHLQQFPTSDEAAIDRELETKMALVRQVVGMGRTLRSRYTIRNRQPLARITIVVRDNAKRALLARMADLITEELNVKQATFDANEDAVVQVSAKANFKALGKVLGPRMKEAAAQIEKFTLDDVRALEGGASKQVCGQDIVLAQIDVRRTKHEGIEVESAGELTVALDTHMTPELVAEGIAREFVNRVQNLRKSADLNVSDRIAVVCGIDETIRAAVMKFEGYVRAETLATSISWDASSATGGEAIEIGEVTGTLRIVRVG